MNAIPSFETDFADRVDAALLKSNGEAEMERMADLHRQMVAKHEQRIADTRKGLKGALATLTASAKAEKKRHANEMAAIAERTAEAREVAASDIETDQKIAAASRAWLKAAE
jgi:1,6-anhydro-N-acetylmuramate kinase